LPTPVSATCSRTCSRACCRRCQRRAFQIALLLEENADGSNLRTLGVAVWSGLEVLAAEAPIVVAIDDVKWLDPSSATSGR